MRIRNFVVVLLLTFMTVSTAYAQSVSIDFNQILARLGPRTGTDLLFDILLYTIFGLGFVTMLLVPDKQLLASMIMVLVLFMAVLAKIELFGPTDFAVFVINVGMWVLPWIVAGMVRAPHRYKRVSPKAMLPGILTGILGAGYFFLFWALKQSTILT